MNIAFEATAAMRTWPVPSILPSMVAGSDDGSFAPSTRACVPRAGSVADDKLAAAFSGFLSLRLLHGRLRAALLPAELIFPQRHDDSSLLSSQATVCRVAERKYTARSGVSNHPAALSGGADSIEATKEQRLKMCTCYCHIRKTQPAGWLPRSTLLCDCQILFSSSAARRSTCVAADAGRTRGDQLEQSRHASVDDVRDSAHTHHQSPEFRKFQHALIRGFIRVPPTNTADASESGSTGRPMHHRAMQHGACLRSPPTDQCQQDCQHRIHR